MKILPESVDTFGMPLTELRERPNSAEDARYRLEKAKDEVRRALDDLRDLQPQHDAKQRIGSEIRSAIVACIEVERSLITAIHRTENLIHRVRKTQNKDESKKKPCEEQKVEVPFEVDGKHLVAFFEVTGHLVRDEQGGAEWVGEHEVDFIGVKHESGKEFEGEVPNAQIRRLEDEASERYADQYLSGE